MPNGSIGFRWQEKKGQWNLEMKDGVEGSVIEPLISFIEKQDSLVLVSFTEFASGRVFKRGVPVKYIQTEQGRVTVTTVFDLLMAQMGVGRGLEGDFPENYDDVTRPYTPAWQEQFTGIGRETLVRFAREWATQRKRQRASAPLSSAQE